MRAMQANTYQDLIVWQKAMELVDLVYGYMRSFPNDERFRLCDQLSRAVVSVPSNIAEGNGRASRADYAHFLAIARGSLYETMTQLEIAKRQKWLHDYASASLLAGEIRKMLTAMIAKLSSRSACSPRRRPPSPSSLIPPPSSLKK